jgi:L-ascorbate metabolism protein UlaG (beta-lactamase superfamily)
MLRWFLAVVLVAFACAAPARADDKPVHYSQCQAIAEGVPGATYARLDAAAAAPMLLKTAMVDEKVRITFIGHSTFYIETPAGVTIATDYNGYMLPPAVPMVATMNHAHSTHYTLAPDPRIQYVLHGWSDDPSTKPDYHLVLRDTFIRNVTTDIRAWGGGMVKDGNSIFIFEVAGLCIGHLGHLHEELSEGQYAEVGRLDVLMVPVDGGLTMGPVGMSHVVQRLKASLVLPMHMPGAMPQFLAMFGPDFDIRLAPSNTIEVSLDSLPKKPEILILRGMQ